MTIRALIVDDEEPGRVNLRYALADHPHWQVVGECASADAARAELGAGVDVVFLDIRMPAESGLDLARSIAALADPPLVIFVTAHNDHALEAFDVHALDYLLKPFDDQRLAQALERAKAMLAQRASHVRALRSFADPAPPSYWRQLNVRSVGRIEFVQVEDVLWIEAAGNYVQLHLAGRCVLHRVPLSRIEQHLDPARFLRVHRGAIVRADQCVSLAGSELSLRDGERITVSERYLRSVEQLGL